METLSVTKTLPSLKKSSSMTSSENECVFLRCVQQSNHTNSFFVHSHSLNKDGKTTLYDAKITRSKVISTCFLPPPKMMGEPPNDYTHETPHQGITTIYVKPLIVLDLNGILCRRVRGDDRDLLQHLTIPPDISSDETETGKGSTTPLKRGFYRPSCGFVAGTPIISRTDLHSFLEYLDTHFTLAVWTSAKLRTAKVIVKLLFPSEISQRLLFVWGQNRCERKIIKYNEKTESSCAHTSKDSFIINESQEDKMDDTSISSTTKPHLKDTCFIKSLAKVWNEFPIWDSSNTLLIDDSPEKCPPVHLRNTVHPPPILGFDSSVTLKSTSQLLPDDENQERQIKFFQQLTEIWKDEHHKQIDSLCKGSTHNRLHNFLKEYGRGHMGWRG